MKNVFPIMQITKEKTLVERRKDNGEVIEYIICHNLVPVTGKENEYTWSSGMYSYTLEGILKTAALKCFEPVYKYVLIESDGEDMEENTFDTYEEARKIYEERVDFYREREDCILSESWAGIEEEGTRVIFSEVKNCSQSVVIKLITIKV